MNFPFLIHMVSLHLPRDYPIQISTRGSLEPLNLYKHVSCHFTLSSFTTRPQLNDNTGYATQNLIALGPSYVIHQILVYQKVV